MEKLPADVAIDLVSRLPFDSVLDCRRVSKPWRSVIYHPAFADMHLHRTYSLQQQQQQQQQLDDDHGDRNKDQNILSDAASAPFPKVGFISINMLNANNCQLLHFEYDNETENEQHQMKLTRLNHPFIKRLRYTFTKSIDPPTQYTTVMLGSCNGLICFSVPEDGFIRCVNDPLYICNPIIRESVYVPVPRERLLKGHVVFGFGYNQKDSEYKVVRIYYDPYDRPTVGQVQVYTIGAGSGWRNRGEINYSLQPNNTLSPGVFANGHLHWLELDGKFKILAFDLADEEFRVLPLLRYDHYRFRPFLTYYYFQIQVLGGCLCHIHRCKEFADIYTFKKSIDNDMKEQDYKSWSWSLECSIEFKDIDIDECDLFHLTKSGEVLLWYNKRIIFRYDPKTASLEEFMDCGSGLEVFETIPHVNSFVSLKAIGEENVKIINLIN